MTLRKHGGLFEEGLLSESPKMDRKKMPTPLVKQGSTLEIARSTGEHEVPYSGLGHFYIYFIYFDCCAYLDPDRRRVTEVKMQPVLLGVHVSVACF